MEFKDLFKRELLDVYVKSYGRSSIEESEVLSSILSKVTGKLSYYLDVPKFGKSYSSINSKPTEEEIKKINSLYEKIFSDYKLSALSKPLRDRKGEDYYSTNYPGFRKNSSLADRDSLIIGNEIVCYVGYDFEYGYSYISSIIYSEDSKKIVRDIWIRYSELCYEIIKDHDEEISTIYEITTVVRDSSGSYSPVSVAISPTVSLKSEDFLDNYNKDLPSTKVDEFLKMDKGGIIIFNGHPGCGKSTYLKSLIFKYPNVNFVILPQYYLYGQESFRDFLINSSYGEKDNVFIVEDCEQLLIQRENNSSQFSSIISDILNYTDGIFGDLTRTKFIFTFNTNLQNVDKALLRPGRLFLKYEFSPLIGENLEKIASKLGYNLTSEEKKNGVPLAELYGGTKTEDLVISGKPKKRIGFESGGIQIPR